VPAHIELLMEEVGSMENKTDEQLILAWQESLAPVPMVTVDHNLSNLRNNKLTKSEQELEDRTRLDVSRMTSYGLPQQIAVNWKWKNSGDYGKIASGRMKCHRGQRDFNLTLYKSFRSFAQTMPGGEVKQAIKRLYEDLYIDTNCKSIWGVLHDYNPVTKQNKFVINQAIGIVNNDCYFVSNTRFEKKQWNVSTNNKLIYTNWTIEELLG